METRRGNFEMKSREVRSLSDEGRTMTVRTTLDNERARRSCKSFGRPEEVEMETDTEAITAVLRKYAAYCNSGDFESWIALWEVNGCQMPPDAPSRVGVDAIRKAMQPAFEGMNLKLDLVNVDEATVFGDIGLTRCRYSLTATPKGGGDAIALMPDGKALTLYRRQSAGSWKISYDCFNANAR
jgi:ketosteroid isomerase-like protein